MLEVKDEDFCSVVQEQPEPGIANALLAEDLSNPLHLQEILASKLRKSSKNLIFHSNLL